MFVNIPLLLPVFLPLLSGQARTSLDQPFPPSKAVSFAKWEKTSFSSSPSLSLAARDFPRAQKLNPPTEEEGA